MRDGDLVSINAVTYGPFPLPMPDHFTELARVVKAGFNAIRVYELPSDELMDAALEHGLMVFAGVHWEWTRVFRGAGYERFFTNAKLRLSEMLEKWGDHDALVACYVANEIAPDIARWIGAMKVRESLEELIDFCRKLAPEVLFAYSNYPSSEFLEPGNADFTGFNIYLENRGDFSNYLPRLHHLAGDRPVLISEFGMDSKLHGVERQRESLLWGRQEALDAGMAGTTIFAWSDRWRVGEREVDGWEFGLTDRNGAEKFNLAELSMISLTDFSKPRISVIICVFNGVYRVWKAIESLESMNYPDYEVIVVDDGSTDGTQELVERYDSVNLICADHGGLSNARNIGAAAATGEIFAYTDDDCEADPYWLLWIAKAYATLDVDAVGGPNMPPSPYDEDEAVVAAAPGAPSHVMLNDSEAEHIPGCNLTVSRRAFESIGGFSKTYEVAGDDVDFCWRLEMAGYKIGFHGAAFVWHRRRTSLYRYFKQQKGYGKAEALLMRDHPEKFTRGNGARWKGCVYTGAALGAHDGCFIYHGYMGNGAYQQVVTSMMPRRTLHAHYNDFSAKAKLYLAEWMQPLVRRIARHYYSRKWRHMIAVSTEKIDTRSKKEEHHYENEITLDVGMNNARTALLAELLARGWSDASDLTEWDLSKADERILIAQEVIGDGLWRLQIRLRSKDQRSSSLSAIRDLTAHH